MKNKVYKIELTERELEDLKKVYRFLDSLLFTNNPPPRYAEVIADIILEAEKQEA